MSVHRSLKSKNALTRSRNVLTREERIQRLRETEKWEEGRSVFGLPAMHIKRTKKKAPPPPPPPPEAQPAEAEAVEEEVEETEE